MASSPRTASVDVYLPTHVPAEIHPVWHAAATHVASKGRLIASGKVDYEAVNDAYIAVLQSSLGMGRQASKVRLANLPRVSRNATDVKIAAPKHVPQEMRPLWYASARHASNRGRLIASNQTINYHEINNNYMRVVSELLTRARAASSRRTAPAQQRQASAQPTAGRAPWPFADITPNHIAKFAAEGKWELVAGAARQASAFFAKAR